MSVTEEDYFAEFKTLKKNCRILERIDSFNEYLQFLHINRLEELVILSKFWKRFGPENKETRDYVFYALKEANIQLSNAIGEALEEKGFYYSTN